MKILFITDNFPPEVNAPASRTFEHCRQWVAMGAEVTVITCAPNFPQGKVYPGYRNRLRQTETIEGIKVIRVWSYITSNEGFAKRVLDYISFSMTAFWAGLFCRADVIVATSPQFFTTFTGYALSVLKRKPWVFELRDLWPESIITVGAMKKGRAIALLERIEKFMYRRADLIVPVTDAFRDRLVSYGIPHNKMTVVTNGADLTAFRQQPKNTGLAGELGLSGKFLVGYVGTHGMAHNLEFVMEAMHQVADRSVHLVCIGDGARKQAAVEKARALQLTNVTFLDPVPKDEVGQYLAMLDAVLVPLRSSPTFQTVIPSKIFEAAAMGLPILLGVDGQARAIVEPYGAGLYFEPDNIEAFVTALDRLTGEPSLRAALTEGGIKLAADYDRATLARNMYEHLLALAAGRHTKR